MSSNEVCNTAYTRAELHFQIYHKFHNGPNEPNTPIPLGGDSATLQIFGQIAMDRSRIANSATEA